MASIRSHLHISYLAAQMGHLVLFLFLWSSVIWTCPAQDNPAVVKLFDRADQLQENHLDSAIGLVEEVYRIGVRTRDTSAISSALDYLGFFMDRKGDYKEAINYYNKSLALKKHKGDSSIAWTYSEIGYCYMLMGQYPEARKYMEFGIDMSRKFNDFYSLGLTTYRIGEIDFRSGNLKSAMNNFERSLHIADSLRNLFIMYQSLAKLSDIYRSLKNSGKAKSLAVRAMAVADSLGDKRQVADAFTRMGRLAKEAGDLDKSENYYTRSLNVSESIAHMRGVLDGYIFLGDLAVLRDNYPLALERFRQAKKVEISNRIVQSDVDQRIGSVYFKLDQLDSAFFYAQRAYQVASELRAPLQQYRPAFLLYRIYKKRGAASSALKYYEVFHKIEDSLSTDEFEKELIRKELNFRIVSDSIQYAKDKEIKDLEISGKEAELKSQRRQKMAFLGMGILAIVISVLAFRSLQQRKKANRIIAAEKVEAERQRMRSDELLLNILPSETAEELKRTGEAQAKQFNQVSVLFTDFKDFTTMSAQMDPHLLVSEINYCFSAFDKIVGQYNVEKIKTIGDAYMAAGGLPAANETHARDTVNAALDIQHFMRTYADEKQARGEPHFSIRIGIHTGPVVAGIVGIKKFQYDIWGDTVNTASRMESSGEVGKVNVSESTYELLKSEMDLIFEHRGKVEAKGKGLMDMFFVEKKA